MSAGFCRSMNGDALVMMMRPILVNIGGIFLFAVILNSHTVGQAPKPCPDQTSSGSGSSGRDYGSRPANLDAEPKRPEISPNNSPLIILSKPIARRTDASDCTEGTVLLRIEFLSTGRIGKISLVKGLTRSLNKDAIEAARKIKFRAETKKSESITVHKTVEYPFSIY